MDQPFIFAIFGHKTTTSIISLVKFNINYVRKNFNIKEFNFILQANHSFGTTNCTNENFSYFREYSEVANWSTQIDLTFSSQNLVF